MSPQDIIVLVTISLLIVLLPAIGLYKLFPKAGIESWKAWVPFLNTWEMVKAEKLKKHWFFWQFIPVAGWFISIWILVEFVKLFGKFKLIEHAATVFVPFIYLPIMANDEKDTRYIGPEQVKKHKKSSVREWVDAAVFAIVAATLIRTFVFEAYVIPTGSMEKTLLVNDYLFVSKFSYGPRVPNTPFAIPFVHHTLPFFNSKSYTESVSLPYRRWFEKPVKRNDVVVFNFPAGDTLTKERDSQDPYYDILRREEFQQMYLLKDQVKDSAQLRAVARQRARDVVWEQYTVTTRPVDKRENYIKRCVAIGGDVLEIKDGVLFINGKPAFVAPTSSTDYYVYTKNKVLTEEELRDAGIKLNRDESSPDFSTGGGNAYRINLTLSELEILKKIPGVESIQREIVNDPVFPYDPQFNWSIDNFGPLWVPQKGKSIELNSKNIALYKRVIQVYEGNTWEERDGKVFINGQPATSYTFKMNYYWMMGDNRHRSQDSRYWGFVPEDHIVGEAGFIWMSTENGIRWNRIFKVIE